MFPIPPSECFSFLINQHARRSTTGFKIYMRPTAQWKQRAPYALNRKITITHWKILKYRRTLYDWSLLLQHFYYMLYYILCSARESEKNAAALVVMGGKPCCCISKIDDIYYFSVLFFFLLYSIIYVRHRDSEIKRAEGRMVHIEPLIFSSFNALDVFPFHIYLLLLSIRPTSRIVLWLLCTTAV